MNKIIKSLAVIAFVAAIAIGATSAYFSDSEISAGNTFTSGTLDVVINDNTATDGTFPLDLGAAAMAPGEESNSVALNIKNGGSLNLGWFGYFNLTDSTPEMDQVVYIKDAKMEFLDETGKNMEDGGGWAEPTDHFITNGTGSGTYGGYYVALANLSEYDVVTLHNWNLDNAMGAGNGVQMGALKPGYSYRFTFKLAMVGAAGDEYQGKDLGVQYIVKAGQMNAAALNAVGLGDTRIVDNAGDLHLGWMNTQILHQN